MSPLQQAALGGLILVLAMVALIVFNGMNTRHHTPDEEELNITHEEDVHGDSTDR